MTIDLLQSLTPEQRLDALGLVLPTPPRPLGIYVEAVQNGALLFLTGMLPTERGIAGFEGRVGAELDEVTAHRAARLAALNGIAVVKQHLGSLERVMQVVRLGVAIATSGQVRELPKIADGASELLAQVFGNAGKSSRMVYGVACLPLGVPVELELIIAVRQ